MDTVPNDIINALTQIDGINKVSVEVVWTPKWEVTRISRIGRAELGIAVR
jgi:metal-sulfur cluster biosynthetic enzyme